MATRLMDYKSHWHETEFTNTNWHGWYVRPSWLLGIQNYIDMKIAVYLTSPGFNALKEHTRIDLRKAPKSVQGRIESDGSIIIMIWT